MDPFLSNLSHICPKPNTKPDFPSPQNHHHCSHHTQKGRGRASNSNVVASASTEEEEEESLMPMPIPSWWKKSSKSKEEHDADKRPPGRSDRPHQRSSFDDVGFLRNTASGSSGFDYDSVEKRGLPLPKPSVSDLGPAAATLGLGSSGSVSGSVSSVSSSGSYGDDHTADHPASPFVAYRVHNELKFNTGSRSSGPGSRSPAPGTRAPSRPTSPLHPRMAAVGLEPLIGKLEDCKNQYHPLPLPPGSPSSPSHPSTRTDGVTESPPATPSSWKKGKLLGRGTFGHVYLGFNSVSGQMCAIKEVKRLSDDQTSKECLKQLNQEINLLSRLSHPNIVRYYGSELGDETLSVYLEYVSGGSIHTLLQEYGAFKEPVIQNYTRQILAGLAYLHGRNNCVHRDIKGANILVDPKGEIKLADFGMAKHITAFSSMLSFKGSPSWMAPEVVMNTNGYSLAVDIWSLGCTIVEMATSKPPWSQYEGVAAIFKIGNSRDMPDIPDHLSNNAKSFIKLCLQRDPSLRPTAMQLLDHPFVRDQPAVKSPAISMPGDASPCMFDGSRSPTPLELRSKGPSCIMAGGETAIKLVVTGARAVKGQRDDIIKIASLPVSPSSSPLRRYGAAHKSCLFSPPRRSYAIMAQTGYHLSDYYSSHPLRSSLTYPLDPYYETTTLKAQTPGGSPRMRPCK